MNTPVRPGDLLLNKYRVEHILGQGGMGVVVAARHLELAELFAIKFLLPAALHNSEAVERFVREARAAARLKGSHVVKVHDVGRLESGAPYMVMEHLDGTDLKTLLGQRGPLPMEEAVTYVLHACEAIAEAHRFGIVHRDLKPANLFLTSTPDGAPWIKVLDFGISKQMVTTESHELTATGVILGSPMYMSPEQLARTKDVDARSDIWSLGVVLYELVTATKPFQSKVLTEVVAQVLQDEPAPPSRLRPLLPAGIDAIVLRCLQKRRENRFQTIGELAAALRSLQAGTAAFAAAPPAPAAAHAAANMVHALAAYAPAHAPPPLGSLPLAAAPLAPALPPRPSHGSIPGANTAAAWGGSGATASPAQHRQAGIVAGIIAAIAALGTGSAWVALRAGSLQAEQGAASAPAPVVAPAAIAESPPSMDPAKPQPSASQPAASSTPPVSLPPPLAPVPVQPATQNPAASALPHTPAAPKPPPRPRPDKHETLY